MYTILRLSVYDRPGVLDRITGLIRRSGCNISSVNAAKFKSGMSQINIVLADERTDVYKLGQRLYDINFISDYKVLSADNADVRELALIRMKTLDFDPTYFDGARIIGEDQQEVRFELTGEPWDIDRLLLPVQDKLLDVVRSGSLAISKEGTEG